MDKQLSVRDNIIGAIKEQAENGDELAQGVIDRQTQAQRIVDNQKSLIESAGEGLDREIDNGQIEGKSRKESDEKAKSEGQTVRREGEQKEPESVRQTIKNAIEEENSEDSEEEIEEENNAGAGEKTRETTTPLGELNWGDTERFNSYEHQYKHVERHFNSWLKGMPNLDLVRKDMDKIMHRDLAGLANYLETKQITPKALVAELYELACLEKGINPNKKHNPTPKPKASTAPKKTKPLTVRGSFEEAFRQARQQNAR